MKSTQQKNMTSDRVKKSMLFSGLIGTGGFFIAKLLGIFYAVPFSWILASEDLQAYYGGAYRIYSYILNIFTAGFPFAVATLVARYTALKNYRTVLRVKKVSVWFMALTGLLGMAVMMGFSSIIAPLMVGDALDGAHIMQVVLCLLGIAVFIVPILSAYRGFVQGCKEVEEYAYSQAFEQLFRVGFLLSTACLMVYGLGMSRVWALYAGVLSTSVAALAGLVQIMLYSNRLQTSLQKEANAQSIKAIADRKLLREFVLLAIPYMISAVLGYSDDLYNSILLPIGLKHSIYTPEEIDIVLSAVNYAGTKLTAIPMVLAPGFTAAIIPHISSALVEKKFGEIRKSIKECINIVCFIGLFLSFCIALYAKPIYQMMFTTSNLSLSSEITRWCAVEGFLGCMAPVVSSMMMALNLRKSLLKRLAVCTVIKGVLIIPFTMWWGFGGTVFATVLSFGYVVMMNLIELHIRYKVSFTSTFQILWRTLIGLLAMLLCSAALNSIGIGTVTPETSRLGALFAGAGNGIISVIVFALVEIALHVPQALFHIRIGRKKRA